MKLVLLLVLLTVRVGAEIPVAYYGDISCAHCDTVVDGALPDLAERYNVTFDLEAFDILQPSREEEVRERLAALDLEYHTFPVLFVGNNAYQGNYAIDLRLPEEIEYFLEYERYRPFDRTASQTRYPTGGIDPDGDENPSSPGDPGVLRYFWGVGCPYCEKAAPLIDRLEREYPTLVVERYEVFETQEHHDTFRETLLYYGSHSSGVPQIFFEEYAWIGFSDTIAQQVEDAIRGRMVGSELELPVFGTISPEAMPAATFTVAVALVDGFNPCSLWVLTMLLGLIVHTRSRRKIAVVGGIFLLVTAAVYGLFIAGLLSVFTIAGNTLLLRMLVAAVAVGMGLINVKDYFFFKQGFSLMIPERFQHRITSGSRMMANASGSTIGLAGMTGVFAAGIAIVELPCTAGFPLIWSRFITTTISAGAEFYALLGLYLLVYLLLEIIIVLAALITMGRLRFNEEQARPIKLIGGAIMISLGGFYLVDPEIAATIPGVVAIFTVALAGAAITMLMARITGARGTARRQPPRQRGRAGR